MTSLIRALSESFQYVTAISGAGKELQMCSLQLKQIKESVNVNANVNIFDDVNVSVGVAFFFFVVINWFTHLHMGRCPESIFWRMSE